MTPDEETVWLEWRRGGIGASEIAAVVGENRWQSPLSVYLRKRGEVPDGLPPSSAMAWGKRLEPVMADWFTEETGLYVTGAQTWCQHPVNGWARCTVDGFVVESPDGDRGDALGVVELKTTGLLSNYDTLPRPVLLQVQWQLYVTGLPYGWVAVLGGGFHGYDALVIPVPRDDGLIGELEAAGARFWQDVEAGEPPDEGPVAHRPFYPGDRDDLAAAYPDTDPGSTVELGDAGLQLWADLSALKETAKVTKERIEVTENALKALLGDREVGTVDGEPVVTWKATTTTRLDVTRLRATAPHLFKEWSITTTSRRFLVK